MENKMAMESNNGTILIKEVARVRLNFEIEHWPKDLAATK